MNSAQEDMEHDGDDSDSDFETIVVNPNINYESDDDSGMEELSQSSSFVKLKGPEAEPKLNQEVKLKAGIASAPEVEEVSCDSISIAATVDDDNSINSNDSMNCPKKVRKKLNLEEYKQRRANEKPQTPLFDLPRKVAAFELCDAPATLPTLILPNDPDWIGHNNHLKNEHGRSYNPALYEEIVMVSMGCNTETTIPPFEEDGEVKPASKFLTNIVNNLKVKSELLNSSSTLFSSIQAVVQGKAAADENDNEQVCKRSVKSKEQGEDKTIMHLRKDRLRPFKCTVGSQTDSDALFPPLLLSPSLIFNRIRNSRNYRRNISRSRSRSRSFSSEEEYDQMRYSTTKRYSRSQHSTHSSSMNSIGSSGSSSDSDSDCYSISCGSERSSADSLKRFNKRQNFKFYNRNQRDQGYGSFQEERKIIYIGGLEEAATKDEIRRKFLNYGTIKKISLHVKEDGLRYGFVTFAEVSCAYEVIDKFSKDTTISKYDIRFGGRRKFCKQNYADLDSIQDTELIESQKSTKDMSFEDLLLLTKQKLLGKK